jgi:Plasmid replication region DNA-binding N-term
MSINGSIYVSVKGQDLLSANESITIRKIHQMVGGSFSTISRYYQRWTQEQSLAKSVESELSATFKIAVLAEIGRATATLKKSMEAELSIDRGQLKEVHGLLAEQEHRAETLSKELSTQRQESEQRYIDLMKQLSAANALIEASNQREEILRVELEALRKQSHEAELKTAIAETRFQELEKQNTRLEETIKSEK